MDRRGRAPVHRRKNTKACFIGGAGAAAQGMALATQRLHKPALIGRARRRACARHSHADGR